MPRGTMLEYTTISPRQVVVARKTATSGHCYDDSISPASVAENCPSPAGDERQT